MARRRSYVFSIGVAAVLLLLGCVIYGGAGWPRTEGGSVRWLHVVPLLAMSYGTLMLLVVAVLESRVWHARQGDLLLKKESLGEVVDHITRRQERERERISEVLHDTVGALITAAKIEGEALAARHGASGAEWDTVDGILDEALKEVRGIAANLYPRTVLRIGLRAALEEAVERFRALAGAPQVELDVTASELARTDDETALCVLRVVQECLTNVLRHAGASLVRVGVDSGGGMMTVRIEDDGRGMGGATPGMGLTIAAERVGRLGGEMRADGVSPLGGACVVFRFPYGGGVGPETGHPASVGVGTKVRFPWSGRGTEVARLAGEAGVP